MTRRFARKLHVVRVAALLIAAIAILAVEVSQSQQTYTGRPATGSSGASVPPGADYARHVAGSSDLRKKSAAAADSTPPSFFPAVTYSSAGQNAIFVAVADVNGDGKPDLVVLNDSGGPLPYTVGYVSVLLGNGDGTFQPAAAYPTGAWYPGSLVVADVTGNGKADLLVANSVVNYNTEEYDSDVVAFLGNGDGSFQESGQFSLPETGANSLVVGDVNGDGKPDILVAFGISVGVLLGNGDGTFQPVVTYPSGGYNPTQLVFTDVNGDGKPDIVVGNSCNYPNACSLSTVGVLLGNGDGTFQSTVTYTTGGCGGTSQLLVTDVSGDGKPDIVDTNSASVCPDGTGDGSVSVLLGDGDGTFKPAVSYDSGGSGTNSIASADLKGDGKLDLLVANSNCNFQGCSLQGTIGLLLGNGDGTFQSVVLYGSGGVGANSVTTTDATGDGNLDVVVANSSSVAVLHGNGDGTFQSAATYGSGGSSADFVAVADVNGDGQPDLLVINSCAISGTCAAYQTGDGSVGVLLNNTRASSPTTTALISSANPSIFGQATTFTATVSAASGASTGTVSFSNGSTGLGSVTLVNGSASISVSSLAAGSYSIAAVHPDNGYFGYSTSVPLNQVVNAATTATALGSSLNPAFLDRKVSYTATVTSQYGRPTTGTVAFQDGGVTVATIGLSGDQATYHTSYAASGTHLITATYSGDANNLSSTSAVLNEEVMAPDTSRTVLTTSLSPSLFGQPVTFTATVGSRFGAIPDADTVTFYEDGTAIGTGTTASGVAAVTTSSLNAGTHTIEATFAGDQKFRPSSGTVKQVVKYVTTTAIASSLNPSAYGQAVTLTATVTSNAPNPLTGRVNFVGLGYAALSGGVATFTKTWLNAGTYAITAEYEGESASAPSASSALNQVVNPASTTTVITSSADPSTLGQNVTFTATVTSSTGAHATGTVTFRADATVLGTVPLDGTVATFSTATLPVASFAITAIYNGATDFTGSSDTLVQSIEP